MDGHAPYLRAPVFPVTARSGGLYVWAVQLAVYYRQQFPAGRASSTLLYRKYGHNEGDDPSFPQGPAHYEVIPPE